MILQASDLDLNTIQAIDTRYNFRNVRKLYRKEQSLREDIIKSNINYM